MQRAMEGVRDVGAVVAQRRGGSGQEEARWGLFKRLRRDQ